ncbi:MAG: hypothetical protein QM520_05115 [Gammaproteobacteria bacterium]|nr:hypothetical protein [Gammaproteobacteria bacterium]
MISNTHLFLVVSLLVVTLALWVIAVWVRRRRIRGGTHVSASQGGVVVMGYNSGTIHTETSAPSRSAVAQASWWERALAIVGSLTGILGFIFIFYPPDGMMSWVSSFFLGGQ